MRNNCNDTSQSEVGENAARSTRCEGEYQTFDHELTDETARTGSHGGPNGDLSLASGGPSQEKMCNVAASDQEQHNDSAKQSEECQAKFSHDGFDEFLHGYGKLLGKILWVKRGES